MSPAVSGRTRLLGVIGDPIAHAASPGLVNARFAARSVDAVLVPMQVAPAHLGAAMAGLRAIGNLAGAIITMPHKVAVRAHIDEVTPSAERIGACNMIRRNDDGSLSGTMLDGEGFVAGLRAAGHRVAGKRVVLLGAGGAAGAIAFALCEGGAVEVSIHNRTAATADALQRRLETHYPGQTRVLTRLAQADSPDIIVNATSLGLHSRDALPLDPDVLRPGMLAAEVVIAEGPTPFLAAAQQRGCAVHGGRSMLEAQLDLMLEFAGVGHGG